MENRIGSNTEFYLNKIETVDGEYDLFVAENMCNSFLYSEYLLSNYNLINDYLPQKTQNILDVGCGAGPFSIFWAKRNKEVTAIDLNSIAVECCLKNAHKYSLEDKIDVQCSNINTFCENKKFDIIVTNPPYGSSSYMRDNLIDNRIDLYKKIEKGLFDAEVDDFLTNCWCDETGNDMIDYIFMKKNDLLSDEGIILIVCGDDFLDSKAYMINKAHKYRVELLHSISEYKKLCIEDNGQKFEAVRKFNILVFR